MQEVVYTESEVEAMLKLPRGRIKSWRRDAFGPTWVQLGRERRYRLSDVQSFLEDNALEFAKNSLPPWLQPEPNQSIPRRLGRKWNTRQIAPQNLGQ